MNIYQARQIFKEKIEDYLVLFKYHNEFCGIINQLVDEHLSLKKIDSSILIEQKEDSIFIGDLSAMTEKGFGFEYTNDSLYMGEWKNGKYNGYGYLFNKHICYYGTFIEGVYSDQKKIVGDGIQYVI